MKKIKFKGYLYLILFTSILSLTNCVDIDELNDLSGITNEGATGEDEFDIVNLEAFTLLVYADFRPMLFLNGFNVQTWGGDDLTTKIVQKDEFRTFDVRELDPSNPRLVKYWRDTNVILSSIGLGTDVAEAFLSSQPADISSLPQEEQDIIIKANEYYGELLFLRALSYHQTYRIFGKAALTKSQLSPATELSGTLEVLEQVESDLLIAIANLPDIQEGISGAQRPNKGSARALLARVYMDWAGYPLKDNSKYAAAAEQAKLVIENKAAHGFDLMDNFADLWFEANNLNKESCFLFAYNKAAGLDNRKYGQVGLPGVAPYNGWDEGYSEIRFFEDFPDSPRKEGTFRLDLEWEDFATQANPVYTKLAGPLDDLTFGAFSTERSDFWIRYADVLLMYAEASARAGQIDDLSWEALNQVRRRAEGLPFESSSSIDITSGDLASLAVTERKWELAGEWLRWYDLVRLELVADALTDEARSPRVSRNSAGDLLMLNNPATGDLSPDNYFAVIPPEILAENPGFVDD